jgi:hypothetical protein
MAKILDFNVIRDFNVRSETMKLLGKLLKDTGIGNVFFLVLGFELMAYSLSFCQPVSVMDFF